MKYVIIGNTAAGIAAAQEIRKLESDSEILMISKEKENVYSRCLLPDYISGEMTEKQLYIREPDFYTRNNIKTLLATEVVALDPNNKKIELQDGSKIHYDRLLLATGSKPFIPPVKGMEKVPTYTLNSLTDAKKILNDIQNKNKIVIVGGGFIGLELAFALRKKGKDIHVIEKSPRILSMQLDEKAAGIISQELTQAGIALETGVGVKEIVANSKLLRFLGAKDIKGVVLENGTMLPCDMVIFAAGTRPNVDLLQGSGISVNKGIIVNEYMATNIPDIYAAGDVVETVDVITGSQSLSPIWPNAVIQGKYAGWNMTGRKRKFVEQVSIQNTSEFREVPFISVGIINPPNQDEYEVLTYHNALEGIYKKIILKDDVPVGMIFLGDISNAGVVAGFIRTRKKASQVKNLLLSNRYNYAQQLVNF